MTDILGALEDTECQRGEEISRCQKTSSWAQGEASVALKEVVHLLQLWDSVVFEDLFLFELCKDQVVLAACVLWHQTLDDFED